MSTAPRLRNRAGVLLDRDGTIIVDYHYVGHIERVQFIPGAIEAIRRFNQAGIPVAITTNQSGVARGFYPEENVIEIHQYIQRELDQHGAYIDLFLYSPDHPEGNIKEYTKYRYWHKPAPGMAYSAEATLDLDLQESWVVGDRISDMEMAYIIRANGVYLGSQPLPYYMSHFYQRNSLADAAGLIIERITGVHSSEFPTMSYNGILGFFVHYSDEITTALSRIDKNRLEQAADILYKAYSQGNQVFIAGNGGSAAIADHMATDHIKHMSAVDTLYHNVHSLTANNALTSALANDIGYDAVFSRQIELSGDKGDVLVVFSVSGESQSIISALARAREMGMHSIAITGETYSIPKHNLATVHIEIPATNYGVCEDIMSILQHSLAQYIRQTQMSDRAIQHARF